MGLAFARRQREPRGRLVVVLDVQLLNAGGDDRVYGERGTAAVIEDGAEGVVLVLRVAVDAARDAVALPDGGDGRLQAGIIAGLAGSGRRWLVVGVGLVLGLVVVVEGRELRDG